MGIMYNECTQKSRSRLNKRVRKAIHMNKGTTEERWLSTQEASAYLGKTPKWLRENSLLLEIPHMRVGRQYRFKRSDLDMTFKVWIMNEYGLICAGSLESRKKSITWLKKQLRSSKRNLVQKKQIQKALNLVLKMNDEEYIECVNSYLHRTFYTNNVWNWLVKIVVE